jgi:uncharacterized protein YuzE
MEKTIEEQEHIRKLKKSFMYDDFSDSLMVFAEDETGKKHNYLLGDFIISLNEEGAVVGLEIRGVSYLLENYDINPGILDTLEHAELKSSVNGTMIYIFLILESAVDSTLVKHKIPLVMPLHQDFL